MITDVAAFRIAYETDNIRDFLTLLFPRSWAPIAARIVESGATFSKTMTPWAPKWSRIPPTVRQGADPFLTYVKSTIFRVHDCIHQLWGLPIPSGDYTENDFYCYKRAQMCGEVAVLTLTEFVFCKYLYEAYPTLRTFLRSRNAVPLVLDGPLQGKTTLEIAMRLDDVLHKQRRPQWLRNNTHATCFANDYVPMLEADRRNIDHNWGLMKAARWLPVGAPNARYDQNLDGLELTMWMINDFYHLMGTDSVIDEDLARFNRIRRSMIELPTGWGQPPGETP